MAKRIAHIEVCEDDEYIICHEEITEDYTIEMIREDYSGSTVTEGCPCRNKAWEGTIPAA